MVLIRRLYALLCLGDFEPDRSFCPIRYECGILYIGSHGQIQASIAIHCVRKSLIES